MPQEARVGIQVWRVKIKSTGEIFFYKELGDAILMARFMCMMGHFVEIL